MNSRKETPVLLLTGYLGSGKTTLLNNILANEKGIRFAVIVNDIGEVNIDADLIAKGGIVGGNGASDLVALQNGCICCTLQMDLVKQLTDLVATGAFDYIVIEASGICEPEPIARTISSIPSMGAPFSRNGTPRLDCIATVVDALRLKAEFDCGDSLTKDNTGDEDLERLVIEQIEFCNVIILNKVSEVSKEDAERIRLIIRALQPEAKIISCDYCNFDLDEILGTGMFDYESVATSATWVREVESGAEGHEHHDHDHHDHDHEHEHDEHGHHHHHHHHDHEHGEVEEYGIRTFVYFSRKPFDLNKFDFLAANWPKEIIRTKGLLYFSNNKDMSYLFEQAGPQKKLTEAGLWYATAPKEELEFMMERDPQLARDWDDTYGDRMIKLVFIGQHLDIPELTKILDNTLA